MNLDELLSQYVNLEEKKVYTVSNNIKEKYKHYNFPLKILIEVDINTKFRDNYVKKEEKFIRDSEELEQFRVFKAGFLRNKGIFYCEGVQLASEYDILKNSMFTDITNGAFNGRYCLPLCLPNGDVYTWMTYDPNSQHKYMMPKAIGRDDLNFFHQGNIMGNLESLNKYDKPYIYFAEGMFDAYRVEEQFEVASVALLGSRLTSNKIKLLKILKEKTGKRLIYVPDFDEAGTSNELIYNPIWDDIFNYAKKYNTKVKDIDQYFRMLNKN